jgi:hypothetical protein
VLGRIEDILQRLRAEVALLQLEITRVRSYAEQSDRMHHEAIRRLSVAVHGTTWPPR